MSMHDLIRQLREPNKAKIVLLVADGLGGLPIEPGGKTELETARTPHLDALAAEGIVGLSLPVAPGITPGSGPGHLGLFGFDPLDHQIGRGVLEALGIGVEVGPKDVAIRGNFCTIDAEGRVTDRRAGRIPTETCEKLVGMLRDAVQIDGVETLVAPVREYRLVVRFRGEGLGDNVADTDPLSTGLHTLEPKAGDAASEKTARVAAEFLRQAKQILKNERPANFLMLRGFAKFPDIATMADVYGVNAVAIAVYPMYRGLARLVGMTVVDPGKTIADQMEVAKANWGKYDFFFIHYKYTDSTGEDGNFARKVEMIEALDAEVPKLRALNPDVLIVTGDHSTPSRLRSHSFHPVPTLLWAPATVRPDLVTTFGERPCLQGGLGQFLAKDLMPLALAHAERLQKFGA
ncbi:MAG: 2,3-bisphosphoglycerate-independent phosphoglycerate mutase [Planctomycetaceae bacterium]|nr:2,3-bisphosphoglycerate-independent phosphoglycerate mutase [Planctomycetaceae bacterium]MBV8314577.1 2,3-bisphosphoglycerate-independent phosphoglycerate mutase [Planctomycetaceae bacterium]MBV8557815.1 2,3-bisphosphoglycerate-independent phosphoglycerate mutase [Planctomycetaceae bacterium]MBV8677554.1 2,3-bisphosphoglycerate-independent phosphoglycerate mutase [Planctomycetaceae bacterium]